MEDKKKKAAHDEKPENPPTRQNPKVKELPDVDDLIFADEYIKHHSEK